jgi:hypothetical protein
MHGCETVVFKQKDTNIEYSVSGLSSFPLLPSVNLSDRALTAAIRSTTPKFGLRSSFPLLPSVNLSDRAPPAAIRSTTPKFGFRSFFVPFASFC